MMIQPINTITPSFKANSNGVSKQNPSSNIQKQPEPTYKASGCLKYIVLGGVIAAASFVGIKSCVNGKSAEKHIEKTVQVVKDSVNVVK